MEQTVAKQQKTKKLSKEAILEEAKKLFSTNGYRATTLKDLSSAFGVSRPSFYYYFKSKVDILLELHAQGFNKGFDEFNEIMSSQMPTREKFRKILESHARTMANYAVENKILYLETNEMPEQVVKKVRERRRQNVDQVRALYKQGVEEGVFKDFDPSLAEHLLHGACNWVTMWYSAENNSIKPEAVVETLVEILCSGYEK